MTELARKKGEGVGEGVRNQDELVRISSLTGISTERLSKLNDDQLKNAIRDSLKQSAVPPAFHEFITKELTDKKDNGYDALIANLANIFKSLPERKDELITAVGALKDALTKLVDEKTRPAEKKKAEEQALLASMFLIAEQVVVELNQMQHEKGVPDAEIIKQNKELHDKMDKEYLRILRETGNQQKAIEGVKLVVIADFTARLEGIKQRMRENGESQEEIKEFRRPFLARVELAANSLVVMDVARRKGDAEAMSEASNAQNLQELRRVNSEHQLMSEFAFGALLASTATALAAALGSAGAEAQAPGAQAAADAAAQMDAILKQGEAQRQLDDIRKMLEELKDKKESVGEAAEGGKISAEALELLEKMGVEKESTIKEALEAVEKIIANVEMQNEKINELTKGFSEEGWAGMPPMHPDPQDVLEKNGIMEDGRLTELGKEVMPELLKESAADFMMACDTILFRIDIVGNEELMDKLNGAKRTVEEYMVNPESVGIARFNEVMADPEIVAVKAAFFEALAENAGEVVANRAE